MVQRRRRLHLWYINTMKKWLKNNLTTIILVIIGLIGAGLIAYPSFADWYNSFHQSRAVASYVEAVSKLDKEDYEKFLADAEAYNEALAGTGNLWKLSDEQTKQYEALLDVTGTGIMGYIDIPKIQITLPIYHGTDETVLQIAIGHLSGTSLPVGGPSTHCVVSGHRGLPSAKLFTDLDQMKEGDTFTMTVLDRTVTYEVDQIRIVEPTDLSDLQIVEGQDLCTLVTCTPYGINTHRLLVRGHRVANANGSANVTAEALQIESMYVAILIAAPILLTLLIIMLVRTGQAKRRRRRKELLETSIAREGKTRRHRPANDSQAGVKTSKGFKGLKGLKGSKGSGKDQKKPGKWLSRKR